MDQLAVLRHYVATLGYRGSQALHAAPDYFAWFNAGHGVRSPVELLSHTAVVLEYARARLAEDERECWEVETWEAETERFYLTLERLDEALLHGAKQADDNTMRQMIQGPLADAMTHIGQLTMLRRLAGAPVPQGGFVEADVRTGRLRYPVPEGET
ncbi:hypothetical protein M6D81_05140 [Paenibacillus sp. J5C_2022]|uniref:hypothetical protein n=1 Tax=Paenibacillus sp. J5C2022 TaxID=2977129 RepID=UPI0021D168DD|nr:hypothetical protein [Paenibacillus sp. J5C2022]MCU6708091.1 hypothetical protein [Paenibacillus sp. J5C2022]